MINIVVWDDKDVDIDLDNITTNKKSISIDSDTQLVILGNSDLNDNAFFDYMKKINSYNKISLEVKKGSEVKFIPLESIDYFESLKRKVIVYYDGKCIDYYHKFQDLDDFVSQHGFIRCHRSYIVNKSKVSKVSSLNLVVNEFEIPIGRKYKESILNNFL